MKKTITLVGVGIAALATIFGIITLCTLWSDATSKVANCCFGFAFLLSLVSYILCGGMGRALKSAWGVAKTMWFLVPVFPVDLCMGIVGFFMGVCMFFCLPIFFVLKSVRERAKEQEVKRVNRQVSQMAYQYQQPQYSQNQYTQPQYSQNVQYVQYNQPQR